MHPEATKARLAEIRERLNLYIFQNRHDSIFYDQAKEAFLETAIKVKDSAQKRDKVLKSAKVNFTRIRCSKCGKVQKRLRAFNKIDSKRKNHYCRECAKDSYFETLNC